MQHDYCFSQVSLPWLISLSWYWAFRWLRLFVPSCHASSRCALCRLLSVLHFLLPVRLSSCIAPECRRHWAYKHGHSLPLWSYSPVYRIQIQYWPDFSNCLRQNSCMNLQYLLPPTGWQIYQWWSLLYLLSFHILHVAKHYSEKEG